MGLDMWLMKKNKKTDYKEEICYWRKANQIHHWFVENVQNQIDDCNDYEVSKEQLKDLLQICKKVKNNKIHAQELLPTCEGFFFGDTEYDEYYWNDIDYTIEMINKVLKEVNFDEEIVYYYSWW